MKIRNTIFEGDRVVALNELITLKLPLRETYNLVKLVKEIKEKEQVYRDAKLAIFRKYGKEKKGVIEIIPKNQEQANKELNELVLYEEEYSLDKKIVLPKEVELSAVQVMLLEDIIEI